MYAAGKQPSPVTVTLPAAGIVQRYPLDRYTLAFSERAVVVDTAGETAPVPSQVSLFFQVPGWAYEPSTAGDAAWRPHRPRWPGPSCDPSPPS